MKFLQILKIVSIILSQSDRKNEFARPASVLAQLPHDVSLGVEKHDPMIMSIRYGEATVTVVDPRSYMTYQPFLPEIAAGSIEARHAIVPLRSHLKRTRIVGGKVSAINHAKKTV